MMNAFVKLARVISLFSLLLFSLSLNENLATMINDSISAPVRIALSYVTGIFNFSIFEVLFLTSPVFIFLFVYLAALRGKFKEVISVFLIITSLYLINLGVAYNARTNLSTDEDISKQQLIESSYVLLERINSFSASECPRFQVSKNGLRVKENVASGFMMRMRAMGFYSFVSSEANVNRLLPDFMYYFTAYHELAHVLGYAREGEANLFAYLSLKETGNEYLSFCADLYSLMQISGDLYRASAEDYEIIFSSLSSYSKTKIHEYRALCEAYTEIKLFGRLSEAHLSIWDDLSYSDFTRLLVLRISEE